jgi:hypothetical protein
MNPPLGIVSMLCLFLQTIAVLAQQKDVWPRPTPDSLRQEVLTELKRYYTDFSARDWKAYASHFWPRATLTTVWQPPGESAPRVVTTTLDEFIKQTPLGPDSKPIFEERMLEAVVRGYENLAQVWARYAARFGEPGQVMEWKGVDAFTLMKHGGRWRIVSLSYTDEK